MNGFISDIRELIKNKHIGEYLNKIASATSKDNEIMSEINKKLDLIKEEFSIFSDPRGTYIS